MEEAEARPGAHDLLRQGVEPAPHRRHLTELIQRDRPAAFDQPRGPVRVAPRQRMADRLVHLALPLVPVRRPQMQGGNEIRLPPVQVTAEHLGEEMVVAIPAALFVERDEEQVGLLGVLQQGLSVVLTRHGVAQLRAQVIQQAGVQQEALHSLRLGRQDLLGQVVQHEAVAPGEGGDEGGGVGMPAHGQGGELQPGGPALGARLQRADRTHRQVKAHRVAQKGRGLVGGEAQIGGPEFEQLPTGAQARQRQRRVGARGEDDDAGQVAGARARRQGRRGWAEP